MNDYQSIGRYLRVLWEMYPKPISQTELATKAGVSKAAISKIKDRLNEYCDVNMLAFHKKLILRNDSRTYKDVLKISLLTGNIKSFIQSEFTSSMVEKLELYNNLSESVPAFSHYFNEREFEQYSQIIRSIVSHALDSTDLNRVFRESLSRETIEPEEFGLLFQSILTQISSIMVPELIGGNLKLFNTKEEIEHILVLRDKLFFLISELLDDFYQNMQIIQTVKSKEEKSIFISVYKRTIEFYFKKFLEGVSETLLNPKKNDNTRKKILSIGSYFDPSQRVLELKIRPYSKGKSTNNKQTRSKRRR